MSSPDESHARRVLLVDDDKKFCRLLIDYLKPLGYDVKAAHTGPEGGEGPLRTAADEVQLAVPGLALAAEHRGVQVAGAPGRRQPGQFHRQLGSGGGGVGDDHPGGDAGQQAVLAQVDLPLGVRAGDADQHQLLAGHRLGGWATGRATY